MADVAPSGTVWGSIVTGNKDTRKGRIGLYTNVTSTDTQTTVELQVWFWTMYSCADGASILLKLDIGTDITAATTTVLTKKAISHTVATGTGWNTKNQTMLYSVTKTYSRGTAAVAYKIYAKFSGIDMLPDKTMSANTSFSVPKLASYTVSYDANGGSGAPSSQTKWHGTNLTLSSSKPTRTGYAFSKWLSTTQNQYYNPGNLYGHNASTTMKAQWTANTYTVSYNANGGTGAPSSQTKTYGVALTLSSTKPTRTNYNFLGWATSASATAATYAAGASYTANSAVTLYAVWELAYTKPRITGYSVTRCNESGTAADSGTYALVKFSWATDNAVSSIKVEWSSSADSGSATISASGTSGNVSQVVGNGGISADATYTVKLTVADGADTNHTSTATATLSGTAFAIDFLAGGKGAAFGKPAEKANALEIDWPVYNNGSVHNESDIYDKFGMAFHNGLAAYTGGGDTGIDPNTTLEELILTSHSNAPQGLGTFYYIHTVFYNTKSATAARSQIAFPYNKTGSMYHRYFASGAWSTWGRTLMPSDIAKFKLKTYSDLSHLGLSGGVTTDAVLAAMPEWSVLVFGNSNTDGNYLTDRPTAYCNVIAYKSNAKYGTAIATKINSSLKETYVYDWYNGGSYNGWTQMGTTVIKQLWKNGSMTSSFAAQTVLSNVDLSAYKWMIIIARITTSNPTEIPITIARIGGSEAYLYGHPNGYMSRRKVKATTTGVTFTDAEDFKTYNRSTAVTNNAHLLPVLIFGVKGVD